MRGDGDGGKGTKGYGGPIGARFVVAVIAGHVGEW